MNFCSYFFWSTSAIFRRRCASSSLRRGHTESRGRFANFSSTSKTRATRIFCSFSASRRIISSRFGIGSRPVRFIRFGYSTILLFVALLFAREFSREASFDSQILKSSPFFFASLRAKCSLARSGARPRSGSRAEFAARSIEFKFASFSRSARKLQA